MTARRTRLAQAAEWRLLGLLFERPRPGWHAEVAALAVEVQDQQLRQAAHAASAATEGEYLAWFGPGGTLSPRAVTYRSFEDPGQILADLTMWFDTFAFQPQREDPPDHLAVEVGFVGFLLLKEAYAVACGDAAGARQLRAARGRFLEAHLAALVAGVCRQRAAMGATYLGRSVDALAQRLGKRLAAAAAAAQPPRFDGCAACTGAARAGGSE
jgi:nitrate reductase assembly molybdenum cofactor insertion protein NarJ